MCCPGELADALRDFRDGAAKVHAALVAANDTAPVRRAFDDACGAAADALPTASANAFDRCATTAGAVADAAGTRCMDAIADAFYGDRSEAAFAAPLARAVVDGLKKSVAGWVSDLERRNAALVDACHDGALAAFGDAADALAARPYDPALWSFSLALPAPDFSGCAGAPNARVAAAAARAREKLAAARARARAAVEDAHATFFFGSSAVAAASLCLYKCALSTGRSLVFLLLLASLAGLTRFRLLGEELATPWGSRNAQLAHGALLAAGLLVNLAAGSRKRLKSSPGSFLGRKDDDHIL